MSCLPCSTAWRQLQKTLERLRGGASRRVEMETALLCLCSPELDTSTAALLRRLQAVETALRAGTFAPPEGFCGPGGCSVQSRGSPGFTGSGGNRRTASASCRASLGRGSAGFRNGGLPG